MNDKRPVNLDIGTISLPITAYTSILHRVSGVVLFFATGILLWMLDASLASQESFDSLKAILTSPFAKLVLWGILAALVYHLIAGIRHLFMDFGIGETLEGGVLGARIVIGFAALSIIIVGAWIWL
ncbi:MAG: succinate dehydrogenase, cytochrome b556 subunit [Gammaproteobacteria bacterium]|nr:MAG: succinate dehydrogenase, cytochrome b556 subunit [Gammaproteobacteria bacterium]RLA53495.1 MAG: succinate dehydrogenase, cytochrome b556 subunit [Gammaproteobacteria bacterium]